jgi:hypothetical protein
MHGESHATGTSIVSTTCRDPLPAGASAVCGRGVRRPVSADAIGLELPAQPTIIGRDLGLTMRLVVHVLARFAITATCTSSAAALEAPVEPINHPFIHEQPIGADNVEFTGFDDGVRHTAWIFATSFTR